MNIIQLALLTLGVLAFLGIVYMLVSGPNAAKASQRRLEQVRFRHSQSTDTKVESQLKKAIAARRPKMHRVAGSGSRIEALAIRLDRTGKGWTLAQYAYASLGLAVVVSLLMFLRSGSLGLSLAIGIFVGAGLPHFIVGRAIKKRTNNFNTKFPDGIELLVREPPRDYLARVRARARRDVVKYLLALSMPLLFALRLLRRRSLQLLLELRLPRTGLQQFALRVLQLQFICRR